MEDTTESNEGLQKENLLIVNRIKQILEREKLNNNRDSIMKNVSDEKGELVRHIGIGKVDSRETGVNYQDLPPDFVFPVYEITDAGYGGVDAGYAGSVYMVLSGEDDKNYAVQSAYLFNDNGQATKFRGILRTSKGEVRQFGDLEPGDYEKVHHLLNRVEGSVPQNANPQSS